MVRSLAAMVTILLAASAIGSAARAEEPIETDRPDESESSEVVGAGRFQVETGLQWARDRSAGATTRTLTLPTLLRLGISESIELRLEGDGPTWQSVAGMDGTSRTHGVSGLAIGAKWHAEDDDGHGTPSLAWLVNLETPTGTRAFREAGFRPSLRAVAEWALPHDLSIGVMPGVVVDRQPGGSHTLAGILVATFGQTWTPRWRSFIELAGEHLAARRNGGSAVSTDTGVIYLVTDDVQLDLSISRGLSRAAIDLQGGAGLSVRF